MKSFLLKFTSILLGIFVALLILEVAYRIKLRYFGNYEVYKKTQQLVKYSNNEQLLVELIPNADITINKTRYSVNSLGFRDVEWVLGDTSKTNIGLISDSVGFPYGLNREEGYEHYTESLLSKDSISNEIYNLSLNGYNANQYIEVLKRIESENFKLDYLIANITSNDDQPTGKPSMLSWINHPTSKYRWIPSKLIKRVIEFHYRKNVQPKLYSFSYVENYINYLKKFQDKYQTEVLVLLIPSLGGDGSDNGYFDKVEAYAKRNGLHTLYLKKVFLDISESESLDSYYYPNDSMHLSKKGHKFVATFLSNSLKKLIVNQ